METATATSIYCGNLDISVTSADLIELLGCDEVEVHRCSRDPKMSCYAYLTFATPERALEALNTKSKSVLNGRSIRLLPRSQQHQSTASPKPCNLYVGKLKPSVDEATLFAAFEPYGGILRAKVHTNPHTNPQNGRSKGYGFCQMESREAADKAIQALNGSTHLGSPALIVAHSIPSPRTSPRGHAAAATTPTAADSVSDRSASPPTINPNSKTNNIPEEVARKPRVAVPSASTAMVVVHGTPSSSPAGNGNGKGTSRRPPYLTGGHGGQGTYPRGTSSLSPHASWYQGHYQGHQYGHGHAMYAPAPPANASTYRRPRHYNHQSAESKGPSCTLYVRPIPEDLEEVGLMEMFSPYGTVVATKILLNLDSSSRGAGFVQFATREEAEHALQMTHGRPTIQGRLFRANWAERPLHLSVASGCGGLTFVPMLTASPPPPGAAAISAPGAGSPHAALPQVQYHPQGQQVVHPNMAGMAGQMIITHPGSAHSPNGTGAPPTAAAPMAVHYTTTPDGRWVPHYFPMPHHWMNAGGYGGYSSGYTAHAVQSHHVHVSPHPPPPSHPNQHNTTTAAATANNNGTNAAASGADPQAKSTQASTKKPSSAAGFPPSTEGSAPETPGATTPRFNRSTPVSLTARSAASEKTMMRSALSASELESNHHSNMTTHHAGMYGQGHGTIPAIHAGGVNGGTTATGHPVTPALGHLGTSMLAGNTAAIAVGGVTQSEGIMSAGKVAAMRIMRKLGQGKGGAAVAAGGEAVVGGDAGSVERKNSSGSSGSVGSCDTDTLCDGTNRLNLVA